jgi:GAF domain-containing protein
MQHRLQAFANRGLTRRQNEAIDTDMAEAFAVADLPAAKAARYDALRVEIAAVLEGEANSVARMATVAAMLAQAFDTFFWTGFYVVDPARPGELVVGPYQGTLGCLRIAFGRGVCGAAAAARESVIVPDVEAFSGHIACDSRSRSEIVVPVLDAGGALLAVLDIDSTDLAAFDEGDREGLEAIARLVPPPSAA